MDPVTLAALGTSAVSAGGSLLGGISTNAANAAQASNANYIQSQEFLNSARIQQQEFQSGQQFNASQAAQTRDWAANQAQIQRDYQTNMSNTAYQRAVAGMKAAGLNPILSAGTGGASTPLGAMPSVGAASSPGPGTVGVPSAKMANVENVFGGAVNSALQGARAATDVAEGISRARLNNANAGNLETGGSVSSPVTTVLNPVKKVIDAITSPPELPAGTEDSLRGHLFGPGGVLRPPPGKHISMPWDAQSQTAPPNPSSDSTASSSSAAQMSIAAAPKSEIPTWIQMRVPRDYPRSNLGSLPWGSSSDPVNSLN